MDDLFCSEKELILSNISKFPQIESFINNDLELNIDIEIQKEWDEIFPLFYEFIYLENVEKFDNYLGLWKNFEEIHVNHEKVKNKEKNYITKEFKNHYYSIEKNKIKESLEKSIKGFYGFYNEFIIGGFLFEKFGIENIYINFTTVGRKDVDFMVKYNSEDYYIELKSLNIDESYINNREVVSIIEKEISKLNIKCKGVDFTLSPHAISNKEKFVLAVKEKLDSNELGEFYFFRHAYFSISVIDGSKGHVKGNGGMFIIDCDKSTYELKEKIEELDISNKKITFCFYPYNDKKNDFLVFVEEKLNSRKIGKFEYSDGYSYLNIENFEDLNGLVIGKTVDRIEHKMEEYIKKFNEFEENNILIINYINGGRPRNFEKLFGSSIMVGNTNGGLEEIKFVYDGILSSENGKYLSLLIVMSNYNFDNINFISNKFSKKIIGEDFLKKLKKNRN